MLLKELWLFMKERKKYWMLPVILMLLLLSLLVIFSQAAVLPFIYTVF